MIPLRRFLSKQPHPSMILAEFADGSEKRVRLGVARSKFRDAEEALAGAIRCEAVDPEGAVLRTWECETEAKTEKEADPTAFRDIQLANLLASVADKAVERYASIMQLSFDQNAKLLSLVGGRLAAIERAWHDSLIAQAEAVQAANEAQAETGQDPNLPMVAQLLAQGLGGMNGAAKKDEKD